MADVSKIEITFAGGQAETYDFKDPNAVRYTAQTLTDAQKKQARKNIDAKLDDGKLVLGYITGVVPNATPDSGTFDLVFGFKALGLATNNTTTIGFPASAASTWALSNRYKIIQFEDFVGIVYKNTDTSFNVSPLPDGRANGISMTGQWIHVKSCYSMFSSCSGLTSLDLSAFDTSKVKSMKNMFYGCSSLTSLDLSTFDTSEVTDMSYMFYTCTALETLDISSFDMSKVTSSTSMFLTPPSALTTLKTPKINPLTNVVLPKTMYAQNGTAYTKLPVTTGTSIELRTSWN